MIYVLECHHVNYSPPIWSYFTYDFAEAVDAAGLCCHWENPFFDPSAWYPIVDIDDSLYRYWIIEVEEDDPHFKQLFHNACHPLDVSIIPSQFRQEPPRTPHISRSAFYSVRRC